MTRVVLVPGVLALLPSYAGLTDPVAELRASCLAAVAWAGEAGAVEVVGDPQGVRVGRALVSAAGGVETVAEQPPRPPGAAYVVVGNGSARRTEKAPGHLDERAHAFDDALGAALLAGDVSGLDRALGEELLAALDGIVRLRDLLSPGTTAQVDYDDDPFGVQYWVMRWET